MSSQPSKPVNTRQDAIRAAVKIGTAVVVLGAAYASYATYVTNSKAIKELNKKANELISRDNPKELSQAAAKLRESIDIRDSDKYANAALAEVLALLWAEHGDETQAAGAKEQTDKVVKRDLNLKERFSAASLVQLGAGEYGVAERELIALTEKGIAPAEVVLGLAQARQKLGKLDTLKGDFKQAVDRGFRSPRFTSVHGEFFFDTGDFVAAQNAFQRGVEQSNQTHLRSAIGKARADVARGEKVDESLQALNDILGRADELSPALKVRALAGKAEALYAKEMFADAEAVSRDAVAASVKGDLGSAYGHYVLGLSLAAQKKDGAADAFNAAIAAYPQVARFYFQAALALANAGQKAAGDALFEAYKKSLKENEAFHIARADFLRASGDLPGALASLDLALKENVASAEAYYRKCKITHEQGLAPKAKKKELFAEALKSCEQAVSVREKFPEVYREVGLIYMDTNPKSGEALEQFVKAIQFYKAQAAPKAVLEGLITEVEQRYLAAKLKNNAKAWRTEASQLAR